MEALIIGASVGILNLIGFELIDLNSRNHQKLYDLTVSDHDRVFNASVSTIFGFVIASFIYIINN